MNSPLFIGRFLTSLLILSLMLPSPALALRQTLENEDLQAQLAAGMEEEFRAGLEQPTVLQPQPEFPLFTGQDPAGGQPFQILHQIVPVDEGLFLVLHGGYSGYLRFVETTPQGFLTQKGWGDVFSPYCRLVIMPTSDSHTRQLFVFDPLGGLDCYYLGLDRKRHAAIGSIARSWSKRLNTDSILGAVADPVNSGKVFLLTNDNRGDIQALWVSPIGTVAPCIGGFGELRDPVAVAADPKGQQIWIMDQPWGEDGGLLLAGFEWDSSGRRYRASFRAALVDLPLDPSASSSHWGKIHMQVDGESRILVSSSEQEKIFVIQPTQQDGEPKVVLRYVIHIPSFTPPGTYQSRPVPFFIDRRSGKIRLADPSAKGILSLPSILEMERGSGREDPGPNIFDLIDRDKLRRPKPTLFPVPPRSAWWTGSRLTVLRSDGLSFSADMAPFSARLDHGGKVRLEEMNWIEQPRSLVAPIPFPPKHVEDQGLDWMAAVDVSGDQLTMSLHLSVEISHSKNQRKILTQELKVPGNLKGPESEHERRLLYSRSNLQLNGFRDPRGNLRLHLFLEDESGWYPFSLEGIVVDQGENLSLVWSKWQAIDGRHLIPVRSDTEGRIAAIQWKPYDGESGEEVPAGIFRLPAVFPPGKIRGDTQSAGLEQDAEVLADFLGDSARARGLQDGGWTSQPSGDGGRVVIATETAGPAIGKLYLQEGFPIPADLPPGVTVTPLSAGVEEVLKLWRRELPQPGAVIVWNSEAMDEVTMIACMPVVHPTPAALRTTPEVFVRTRFWVLAALARLAKLEGKIPEIRSETYYEVNGKIYAVLRAT